MGFFNEDIERSDEVYEINPHVLLVIKWVKIDWKEIIFDEILSS